VLDARQVNRNNLLVPASRRRATERLSIRCAERLPPLFLRLAPEAVHGPAMPLQRQDDVHGGDGLAAGVLGVYDGITEDVLHEGLEDTTGLLVDQTGDALDATTACEAADGWLGDAVNVVADHLAVPADRPPVAPRARARSGVLPVVVVVVALQSGMWDRKLVKATVTQLLGLLWPLGSIERMPSTEST
jgi:hypothetical protein